MNNDLLLSNKADIYNSDNMKYGGTQSTDLVVLQFDEQRFVVNQIAAKN